MLTLIIKNIFAGEDASSNICNVHKDNKQDSAEGLYLLYI